MTDEPLKPKRKRWRWIIAGVLLFVAGVGGWWNWARIDARFVGKWRVKGNPRREIHLFADGTESILQDGKLEGPTLRWSVYGGRFRHRIDVPDWFTELGGHVSYYRWRLGGKPVPWDGNYYEETVVRVGYSTIELTSENGDLFTLERLPNDR
jgi:hypothetical protein